MVIIEIKSSCIILHYLLGSGCDNFLPSFIVYENFCIFARSNRTVMKKPKDKTVQRRALKYRAKSLKDGNWVYGFFVHFVDYMRDRQVFRIYDRTSDSLPDNTKVGGYDFTGGNFADVDWRTVTQFTGLYDSDGKEIYDGDLIEWGSPAVDGSIVYREKEVTFDKGCFCIDHDAEFTLNRLISYYGEIASVKVSGDVFGNLIPLEPEVIIDDEIANDDEEEV